MKDEKKQYTPPALSVVTFNVECGYAVSTPTPVFDGSFGLGASNAGESGQEVWKEDTYEGSGWY